MIKLLFLHSSHRLMIEKVFSDLGNRRLMSRSIRRKRKRIERDADNRSSGRLQDEFAQTELYFILGLFFLIEARDGEETSPCKREQVSLLIYFFFLFFFTSCFVLSSRTAIWNRRRTIEFSALIPITFPTCPMFISPLRYR